MIASVALLPVGIIALRHYQGRLPDSFAQGQYRSVIFAAASRNRIPAMYSGIFERPFAAPDGVCN